MTKIIIVSYFLTAFVGFGANAVEDLYPCNLEVKTFASNPIDHGSFYARVYVEDRLANPSSPLKFRWMSLYSSETGVWSGLIQSTEEFRYLIHDIQISKSHEKLGVSYRLGFCYSGSLTDTDQGFYGLVGTINAGNVDDYISNSAIVTGVCDLRNVGNNKEVPKSIDQIPAFIEPDLQFSINLGQLSSGEIGFDYLINSQMNQVPRFCKLAIEIDENLNGDRPNEVDLNQPQFTLQIDKNIL